MNCFEFKLFAEFCSFPHSLKLIIKINFNYLNFALSLKVATPLAICDKTAEALVELKRGDIHISDSTFFYDGGGCC